MYIDILPTGLFQSNCYIVGKNNEGVIIDPGCSPDEILEAVNKSGLAIKYIILTHAHVDHVLSAGKIKEVLKSEVLLCKEDADLLKSPLLNGSFLTGEKLEFDWPDRYLSDGDAINTDGLEYLVIATPGHSPGSICIKVEDSVFTGDTLFYMSIGRTDLGRGSHDDIVNSIKNRLYTLGDQIRVYPGHGQSTSIGFERVNNPYVRS